MNNQSANSGKADTPENFFRIACRYGLHHTNALFPIKNFTDYDEETLKEWPYEKDESFRHEMKNLRYDNTDLESLFHPGIFLKDNDHDGFADDMDFKVYLKDQKDPWLVSSAANLLCRFAMDCCTLPSHPLLAEVSNKTGNLIIFENQEEPSIRLEGKDGKARLHVYGVGKSLYDFISVFCNAYDDHRNGISLDELTWRLRRTFSCENYDGQKAYVLSHIEGTGPYYVDYPEGIHQDADLKEYEVHDRREPVSVLEQSETGYSEVQQLEEKLAHACINETSNDLIIEAALSKSAETRKEVEEKIRQKYPGAHVHVYNAYKQGFSWIEEKCIPLLKKKKAERIVISFRPDIKKGETIWVDEDGAVPIRTASSGKDESRWMELGIRFLQELYPIDDILSENLRISRDSISFEALPTGVEETYIIKGYQGQKMIYEDSYTVPTKERPYLNDYPAMGVVHPEKAWFRVTDHQKIIAYSVFDTDRDWIWKLFQAKTLPEIRNFVLAKGKNLKELQPFFSKLKFEINLDETERLLPCRNDLISTVDALQEDLYFTTLAWFKQLGLEKEGTAWDAPGLILPEIHIRKGIPSYHVIMEKPAYAEAVKVTGDTVSPMKSDLGDRLILSSVSIKDGKLNYHYEVNDEECFSFLCSFKELLVRGHLDLSDAVKGMGILSFNDVTCDTCCMHAYKKDRKIEEIEIPQEDVITYASYIKLIDELKHVPGLLVFQIAQSIYGRKVYAVTFEKEEKGYHSLTHELMHRPCVLVNCRHHANEVSSTTSAFLLIRNLLSEPGYKIITDKMRLLIIPMENTDGAYVHEQLSKEHPYNKLHMARFDGTGNEIAHDLFEQNTMHTEAHGIYCLFRTYYPDLIIDDHGVPTHEWDQPYSGYVSPDYRGFWLPRSILYGYFWNASNPEYARNQDLCHAIADAVVNEIEKYPEMEKWNREWQDRFEKYAHAWMPRMFPADYYRGMINYWIDKKQDDQNMYLSQKWPWVTTCYYTSEVADETAQGKYLKLCAETHLAEDLAILKVMCHVKMTYEPDKNGIIRHRPVLPEIHNKGEE